MPVTLAFRHNLLKLKVSEPWVQHGLEFGPRFKQKSSRTWPVEVTLSSHAGPVHVRRLKPFCRASSDLGGEVGAVASISLPSSTCSIQYGMRGNKKNTTLVCILSGKAWDGSVPA